MAENKTKPTKLSVAAFIDAITDPTRREDAKALVNASSVREFWKLRKIPVLA